MEGEGLGWPVLDFMRFTLFIGFCLYLLHGGMAFVTMDTETQYDSAIALTCKILLPGIVKYRDKLLTITS
jgi:hypothetical protein